MTKVTELTIRAKAAIQYPGWRVDFAGPTTAVLTHVMGRERIIEVRQRRNGPWIRLAKWILKRLRRLYWQIIDAVTWIVPAVIWLLGMWMVSIVVMALAMGVEL